MQRRIFLALQLLLAGWAFGQPAQVEGIKRADHLRSVRYCEIFMVPCHGLSGTVDIYNTIGLNDCPEQQWRSLNVDVLKKEAGACTSCSRAPREAQEHLSSR